MKLKNRETGEVGYLTSTMWNEQSLKVLDNDGVQLGKYTSLAELNEEWEDVNEPKNWWSINWLGGVDELVNLIGEDSGMLKRMEGIGNCFETKEEADLAVRKLKAWKRLKDRGFRIGGCVYQRLDGEFVIRLKDPTESFEEQKDYLDAIDLLFGN